MTEPDGCSLWIDGWWRACCDTHDLAYIDGEVSLMSHIDLGMCVIASGGGVVMGALMAIATTLWWIIKHKGRKRPYDHK